MAANGMKDTRPIIADMTQPEEQLPEHKEFLSPVEERHIDYILEVESTWRSIHFYLQAKGGDDAWNYAQHHCGTAANAYSAVHWSFFDPRLTEQRG